MSQLAFIETIARRIGEPYDVAAALTQTTLRTMAQRINPGEVEDLAELVPTQLRPFLLKDREKPDMFPYEDFVYRVCQYADVDFDTAEQGVAAVMRELRDVVGPKEFADALAQLPKEFTYLTGEHPAH
jgi:uncharacterized protein (DUF2267 family)